MINPIKKPFFFILPLFLTGAGLLLHSPAGASSAWADMPQKNTAQNNMPQIRVDCAGSPPRLFEARNRPAAAKNFAKNQAAIFQASGLQKAWQDGWEETGYWAKTSPPAASFFIKFTESVDGQSAFSDVPAAENLFLKKLADQAEEFASDFNKEALQAGGAGLFPCKEAAFLNSEICYLYRQNAETERITAVRMFSARPGDASGFYEKKTWHPLPPLFPHPIADQLPDIHSCDGGLWSVETEELCRAADCRLLVDKLIQSACTGDASGFYEKKTWHPLPPLFPHPIADQLPDVHLCGGALAGDAKVLHP